ncbi:MAG: response regulator [Candidatus Omnitrophota bacterium]|nr:MAG: response regulator [Candidatus Omnitrophota bacterium]
MNMRKNILVIDDEELVTKSLVLLLHSEGYTTTVAKSGQQALEKVRGNDYDLIICDVRMPGVDGVEVIKQIRAYLRESNRKQIPEILITGYADSDKYDRAMALRVVDYLYKPFENDELLRVVKNTIG